MEINNSQHQQGITIRIPCIDIDAIDANFKSVELESLTASSPRVSLDHLPQHCEDFLLHSFHPCCSAEDRDGVKENMFKLLPKCAGEVTEEGLHHARPASPQSIQQTSPVLLCDRRLLFLLDAILGQHVDELDLACDIGTMKRRRSEHKLT